MEMLIVGFTVFSLFKMVSLTRRKPPEPKPAVSMVRDVMAVVLAAVVYGGVIHFHDVIAGVPLV